MSSGCRTSKQQLNILLNYQYKHLLKCGKQLIAILTQYLSNCHSKLLSDINSKITNKSNKIATLLSMNWTLNCNMWASRSRSCNNKLKKKFQSHINAGPQKIQKTIQQKRTNLIWQNGPYRSGNYCYLPSNWTTYIIKFMEVAT